MKNKKALKIISLVLAVAIFGAGIFSYFLFTGKTDIRHNPTYTDGQTKVACVGDSVTYGYGIANCFKNNYPSALSKMLGDSFCVCNFGISGTTVQDSGDQPYTATKAYEESLEFQPDIIVFMLASNDSKPKNQTSLDEFEKAYNKLLESYISACPNAKIYLCTPATANFPEGQTQGLTNYEIDPLMVENYANIIRTVAKERNLTLIDINTLTENHREWFGKDNVHPTKDGAYEIAKEIYQTIK